VTNLTYPFSHTLRLKYTDPQSAGVASSIVSRIIHDDHNSVPQPPQPLEMNLDLNSLKEAAANLSLYDLKAGVRKVQNGMLHNIIPCPKAYKLQLS